MRGSLTLRLLMAFWLALVVTLLISVFVTQRINAYRAWSALDAEQLADAVTAAQYRGRAATRELHRRLRERGYRLVIIRGSRPLPPELESLRNEIMNAPAGKLRLPRGGLAVIAPVTEPDGDQVTAVAVQMPGERPVSPGLALGLHLVLSLLVITLVAWWVARRLTRPVRGIQQAVRRFAGGELGTRVAPEHRSGQDEIAALARDFDSMAARIETLVRDRDRLLHDVSHEIRSPLARMRLALELARAQRPDALDRCDAEVDRIDDLVEEILTFARLDPEQVSEHSRIQRESTDLAQLCRDAGERHGILADERDIRLDIKTPDRLDAQVDIRLIDRALDNLISNALRYANTRVRVHLGRTPDGIRMAVEDDGPGVAPGHLPRVFEPFWRGGDGHGTGYGLGLALVDRVARAHHGQVQAQAAQPHGLIVTLLFPAFEATT